LEFLPYPQVIPQFCNTGGFGPRRGLTPASPCPWVAHPVSGLIPATARRPLQTRFRCGSAALPPLNLQAPRSRGVRAAEINSPDHSTKGTPSARISAKLTQPPPTARRYRVSGSLSSPSRGAFHPSLTVLVRYRWPRVFSLGGWSPQLPAGFLVPRGTRARGGAPRTSVRLRGSHPLRRGVPATSARCSHAHLGRPSRAPQPRPARRHAGLGSPRFARHYCGDLDVDFSSSGY
jgi:hypothetical protein